MGGTEDGDARERPQHEIKQDSLVDASDDQALLRGIFQDALDAIIILDDEGTFVAANPAACELFGRPHHQLIGRPIFATANDPARASRRFPEFLASGALSGNFVLQRPDGERRDVEYRAKASIVPGRHLSILRDKTDVKELRHQLLHAQKMDAVGRLAGGIAHDFNNIISAITGFASLVQQQLPSNHAAVDDLSEIIEAAHRATALTRQLLVFSRRQPAKLEPVDLNEVIRQLQKLLSRVIGADVDLVFDLAPKVESIYADVGQLEQIVLNLVVNSREAMPEGGAITIATFRRTAADGPGSVQLVVTDTGHGIAEDAVEKIFEPFYTTKESGTGLGLSIVYSLMMHMNGAAEVRSTPGAGTCFELTFPAVRETSGVIRRGALGGQVDGGHETILVVEDEPVVRKLVRMILERAGYRVLVAESPAQAMEHAEDLASVDLLLTDVVMPGMSGFDLVDRFRERDAQFEVLYMSGYAADDGREMTLSDQEIVQKPFQPVQLLRAVRDRLDRRAR